MIGGLAQGALLMGVIYWYSKSMFSMINNYYREEFQRNVMLQPNKEEKQNSFQETETRKLSVENNEINIKILPASPSMEGLPDILKENLIIRNDEKIVTRGSKDILNSKLPLDVDSGEKYLPTNNYEITKKSEENQVNNLYADSINCNQDSKLPVIVKNSYKKDEDLINSQKFNKNHQHVDLPTMSSTLSEQENNEIDKIKNKLYDDNFIDQNNNQNDDIVTVDINMDSLNPSTSVKLNYGSNKNQNIHIDNTDKYSKESQYDGKIVDAKCNHKLAINQLKDKNKCNDNIGSCINTIKSKPPYSKHHHKNKEDVTGNYSNNNKISKNIMAASTSQIKSTNSLKLRSINNNQVSLKESSKLNSDINKFQSNHDNEIKLCRRKSVSEYIAFFSNMEQ